MARRNWYSPDGGRIAANLRMLVLLIIQRRRPNHVVVLVVVEHRMMMIVQMRPRIRRQLIRTGWVPTVIGHSDRLIRGSHRFWNKTAPRWSNWVNNSLTLCLSLWMIRVCWPLILVHVLLWRRLRRSCRRCKGVTSRHGGDFGKILSFFFFGFFFELLKASLFIFIILLCNVQSLEHAQN